MPTPAIVWDCRDRFQLRRPEVAVARNEPGNVKIFLQGDPVRNAVDSYNLSAQHYDQVYAEKPSLEDVPFYLDLARRIGGPVLELACGTGRVLLPIARAGIAIHGVGNPFALLQRLGQDPEARSQGRKRVGVILSGRYSDFSLQQKISAGNDPLSAAAAHVYRRRPDRRTRDRGVSPG